MKKIVFLLILLNAFGFSCNSLQKDKIDIEMKNKFTLQFEELMFFQPTGKFFEIEVDIGRKLFTKHKYVEIDQPELLKNNQSEFLQAIPIIGDRQEILFPVDLSPDRRWVMLYGIDYRKDMQNFRNPGKLHLVDLRTQESSQFLCKLNRSYFSADSEYVYFIKDWILSQYALSSGEIKEKYNATTFFQTTDRERIIYFFDHRIKSTNIATGTHEELGSYKYIAYDSGTLNDRYAYFMTAVSNKGGPKFLHIIDLDAIEIFDCPFSLKEGIVVNTE